MNTLAVVAVLAVTLATLAIGTVGFRISPHHVRLLRRLPRRCGPVLNASAISGEYLSAASFLGVAGLVLAPARRHALVPGRLDRRLPACCSSSSPRRCAGRGAYTLPDFAESRLDSLRRAHARSVHWSC